MQDPSVKYPHLLYHERHLIIFKVFIFASQFMVCVTAGGFPSQRASDENHYVSLLFSLNTLLSKHSSCRWLQTPWRSRDFNVVVQIINCPLQTEVRNYNENLVLLILFLIVLQKRDSSNAKSHVKSTEHEVTRRVRILFQHSLKLLLILY